jgi:ketosteroid isomerase-like protein
MADNATIIRDFYTAFQKKDGRAMGALYADDAEFSDPVFPSLKADEVRAMWRMFTERPGSDLAVEFSDVTADAEGGSAHWDARYTFRTGRKVLNRIDARFTIRDGKIVRHVDSFDLWKWSSQALGPVGMLLGWSPIVRNKVRKLAKRGLDGFLATGKFPS